MEPETREIIRCNYCNLNQFHTESGNCRKCGVPYVRLKVQPKPKLEPYIRPLPLLSWPYQSGIVNPRADGIGGYAMGPIFQFLRFRAGLSQGELSAIAKVPRTYVSRLEHNNICPSPPMVLGLCKALNIHIGDFVTLVESQGDPSLLNILYLYLDLYPIAKSMVVEWCRLALIANTPTPIMTEPTQIIIPQPNISS
jgi:transcriptional regulator with XRE-family HTH domain